jgi:hypothetical protein
MPSGWMKNLAQLENWGNSNRKKKKLTKKEKRAHDKARRLKRLERAEFNNYHVSKIRGKKQSLGSSSRKQEKKGGDNMHRGAGSKGRKIQGNSAKHRDVCPCHPTCEPKFHKRMNKKKSLMKYLHNFKACAASA